MTLKQFISSILKEEYKDNVELAEQLYKFIDTVFWSMVFRRRDEIGNSIPAEYKDNPEKYAFAVLMIDEGLESSDVDALVKIMVDKALKDRIRREFDEEYVEYGFLSVEDGGRGEEF